MVGEAASNGNLHETWSMVSYYGPGDGSRPAAMGNR